MSGESDTIARLREAVAGLHTVAPETVADRLCFSLEKAQEGIYWFRCTVQPWMANPAGTLHGGMAAVIADQAMGFVAYAIRPGKGFSPTVEMQVSYHRPLIVSGELLVKAELLTPGKSLTHLRCEIFSAAAPERLCVSAAAVYAFVPAK